MREGDIALGEEDRIDALLFDWPGRRVLLSNNFFTQWVSKSLFIILFPLTSWRSQGLWSSHPSLVGQFPEPEGGFFIWLLNRFMKRGGAGISVKYIKYLKSLHKSSQKFTIWKNMKICLPEHSSDPIAIKATTLNVSAFPVQANLRISKVKVME